MQRSESIYVLVIYLCTFGNQHFCDFLAATLSRLMQGSLPGVILRIHFRTFSNKQFSNFLTAPVSRIT